VKALLIRWAILAVAIAAAAALSSDVTVNGGFFGYLWVAAVFAIVNALLRPVVLLLTLPLTIVTFGLFALVVNGFMLIVTAWLTDSLEIDGFFTAVLAALVITVVSMILNRVVFDRDRGND
jgi:putative membrane protein